MTSVIVLGGGASAISMLRAARRLGLHTICVDAKEDAPGAREADELLRAGTNQVRRIVAVLGGREDLAAVFAPASDADVTNQVALARRLGLRCDVSVAAARASVDRGFFRGLCDLLRLPGPRYAHGRPERVIPRLGRLRLPVTVRPNDAPGRVTRCDKRTAVPAALAVAAQSSPSRTVLVEELLTGTGYAVEAVVDGGEVALLGVGRSVPGAGAGAGQWAGFGPGWYMPAAPDELAQRLRPAVEQVCRTLRYRRGPLRVDVLLTESGQFVLREMGARPGGDGMVELLGLVNGLDTTEVHLLRALDEPAELAPTAARHAAAGTLTAPATGTLLTVRGLAELRSLPGPAEVVLAAAPGDRVQAHARLGLVLAAADDEPRLRQVLRRLYELAVPEITPTRQLQQA